MLSRLVTHGRRLWYLSREAIGLRPEDNSEALYRLSKIAARMPRRVPGQFEFPFGTVHYIDALSFLHQFQDIYLNRMYDFVAERENPLIVDCGGNIGLGVLWFKQRYPQSRVLTFEADPLIAEVLDRNLRLLKTDGVELIRAAVWTATGPISFLDDGADGGRISPEAKSIVSAVRLSDRITEQVDLLKMDVEGAEFDVIADLCETGKISYVRRLICELHMRESCCEKFCHLLSALSKDGFEICIRHARSAPDIPGRPQPTPFPGVADGKYLMELYAWRN